MSIAGGDFKIPGLGGSKNKDRDSKSKDPTKDNKTNNEEIKDEQEKNKEAFKNNGFNTNKMGKVRFYVHDADGNPIMRALVLAIPDLRKASRKEKKIIKKIIQKQETNLTLPDGYTDAINLFEGPWRFTAIKYHYYPKNVFNKLKRKIIPGTRSKTKSPKESKFIKGNESGDEEQIIEIGLDRTLETSFSPVIFNVEQVSKGSKNELVLEGIIR